MTGEHGTTRDATAAARRAWIKAHHPDHGGDPEVFAAGLARATWTANGESAAPVTAYRRRGPAAVLRRVARACRYARARARDRRRARNRRVS